MPRRDRHSTRSGAGSWIAAIAITLAGGGLIAWLIHSQMQSEHKAAEHGSVERALDQFHDDYVSAVARSRNAAGTLKALPMIPLNPSPGDNKGAIVRNFLDATMNQMIAIQNDYGAELHGIGWEKVLDPDRIGKDKGLKDSQAMIDAEKAAIAKYRDRTQATLSAFHAGLAKLPISDAERGEITQRFDNDPDAVGKIDEEWNMERKVVDEVDDLVGLLRRQHGQWRIVDHKFMFNNAAALSEFQTYVTAAQDMAARSERMQMSVHGGSD